MKKILVLDKKKKMDKMNESVPEILKIHDEKYRETYWNIDKNKRNLLIYKFSWVKISKKNQEWYKNFYVKVKARRKIS